MTGYMKIPIIKKWDGYYNKHGIYNEEEKLRWENNNDMDTF